MFGRFADYLAQRFWGRFTSEAAARHWMHSPAVRRYINESITGSEHLWPLDWFQRAFCPEPLDHGISLGCGRGELERDIARKGICREVLGIDLSKKALAEAERQCQQEGLRGIRYEMGNFNDLSLEREHFDIAFFHQSLHHVRNLEHCLAEVAGSLRPGGLLYLDEYIGPSRGQWSESRLDEANALFAKIPDRFKHSPKLHVPVDWRDPSEAVRSAEIVPVLPQSFEIRERRDYGGNLLSLVCPHLVPLDDDQDEHRELIGMMIHHERSARERGASSFYTVVVAARR